MARTTPPHADDIESNQIGKWAVRHPEWDYIGTHPAQADDHCTLADADELANRDAAAKNDVITDRHVAAENRVVCEDHVVSNLAIMRDVRTHHEEAMVPNFA